METNTNDQTGVSDAHRHHLHVKFCPRISCWNIILHLRPSSDNPHPFLCCMFRAACVVGEASTQSHSSSTAARMETPQTRGQMLKTEGSSSYQELPEGASSAGLRRLIAAASDKHRKDCKCWSFITTARTALLGLHQAPAAPQIVKASSWATNSWQAGVPGILCARSNFKWDSDKVIKLWIL